MKTFNLPDLGEGLQEAEIVQWHVGAGDQVVADQPLVSVETDKAVVEVPSPRAGRIARAVRRRGRHRQGRRAAGGLRGGGRGADTGTVVGEIPASEQRAEEATAAARAGAAVGVKATPAVRALAAAQGRRSGLGQPVGARRRDHRGGRRAGGGGSRRGGAARAAARGAPRHGARMAHAHAEVVPATVSDDADLDAWTDGDVTIRLVRAIVAGCAAEPALNAWYDPSSRGAGCTRKIDLGIAVDTGDGLFVPVLRDVANRAPADLRRGLERMKADILARKIPPEELRGATITLSNFGTLSRALRRAGRGAAAGGDPEHRPDRAAGGRRRRPARRCTRSCRCR